MPISSDAALFARYPDSSAIAAVARHHVADVAVAGTVQSEPSYFVGRRTHALHEEFSLVTEHGLRIDVVDNVALAPALPLHVGDIVAVAGQLIPRKSGALVHDTHHQPGAGWHRGGWIEWHGKRYE